MKPVRPSYPPLPVLRPLASIEALEKRVKALEEDKKEREMNSRRTLSEQESAYEAMLSGAISQLEPRFQAFEKVNSVQLGLLRSAENERVRRCAREEVIREQKERDEVSRAVKAADRRHAIKTWGIIVGILAILVPLAISVFNSHMR